MKYKNGLNINNVFKIVITKIKKYTYINNKLEDLSVINNFFKE